MFFRLDSFVGPTSLQITFKIFLIQTNETVLD
jgi:hypothetical protein